jgi:GNAT superfamily N-acetyltransferase
MWVEARGLAVAFLCTIEDACAQHRIPCPGGHAIIDSRHRLLWDANHIRVESPLAADAAALADAADHHLGGESFRMIELLHEEPATGLREPLARLGYRPADRAMMILGETPSAGDGAIDVQGVSRQSVERSRSEVLQQEQDFAAEVQKQMVTRDAVVATVVEEQCYAVVDHGQILARCQVYCDGAVAQIEHVYTLAAHRRHGYAGAVVTHAARAARASGAVTVFLLTEADDWRPDFYSRLGFVNAGRMPRFLRLLG